MFLRFIAAIFGLLLLVLGIALLWQGAWILGIICLGLAVAVAGQVMRP